MKELIAAFAAEVFRPIVTLLLPGLWALTPGAAAILLRSHSAWLFTTSHSTGVGIAFLAAATAVGMVLENAGGSIENYFFRKHGDQATTDWYKYLAIAVDPQPPGFSYIRTYVLRLKFEVGMASATLATVLGAIYLPIPCGWHILACGSVLASCIYFVFQVGTSTKELVQVRRGLITYLVEDPIFPPKKEN